MFDDLKDSIHEKQERDTVERALNPNGKQQNLKTFRFNGLDDLAKNIAFLYPSVTHFTVTDCDNIDSEGFPILTVRKIRNIGVSANVTNTFTRRGSHLGSQINAVLVRFDIANCMIRNGTVKVKLQHLEGATTTV